MIGITSGTEEYGCSLVVASEEERERSMQAGSDGRSVLPLWSSFSCLGGKGGDTRRDSVDGNTER